MLIPTNSKTKIPRAWCYPIGAEVVSSAFEGAPQYGLICMRFLWVNPTSKWSGNPTRPTRAGFHYTNPERSAMQHNWMLDIQAVRDEEKPLLKPLLCTEVLPRLRAWMTTPRSPAWFKTYKCLYASFNWDTGEIEYSADNGA